MKRCPECKQFFEDTYQLCPHCNTELQVSSVDDLLIAAEEGNAEAQYMLGTCFFCGQGVEKDEKKAQEWWAKAVDICSKKKEIDVRALKTCLDSTPINEMNFIVIPSEKGVVPKHTYEHSNYIAIRIADGATEIEENAFEGCEKLCAVIIPDTVKRIGKGAFRFCRNLRSVHLPEGIKIIEDTLFWDCKNLRSVIIPNSVKTIGEYAFSRCENLDCINIPNGVKKIGYEAFADCKKLTSITIPKSMKEIEQRAFSGCSNLTRVDFFFDISKNKNLTIWHDAFVDCTSLQGDIVLNGKLLRSGNQSESVVIPDGITEIGVQAFSGCTQLKSVVIPEGVKVIGQFAFFDCTSLVSVSIPQSVKTIDSGAFSGCSRLAFIELPEGLEEIDGAFGDCKELKSIVIPNGITRIGGFHGCSNLSSVTIPNSVKEIEGQAFRDCSNLTSIVIPESVETIGYEAFRNCSNLTSISIPKGMKKIEREAFFGCANLTSIVIPESVEIIDNDAFDGCTSLKLVAVIKEKTLEQRQKIEQYYSTDFNPIAGIIDLIRARVNLIRVIQTYVPSLKLYGRSGIATCPFSHEQSHYLNIDVVSQKFNCPICDKSGDMFQFIMEMETLDFDAAVDFLAHRAGIVIIRRPPDPEDAE